MLRALPSVFCRCISGGRSRRREGVYNFYESGEDVRGYNVVRNDNGKVVIIKRVDFDR
jgi:hypothetical protein